MPGRERLSQEQTIRKIEDALDALLTAIHEHEDRKRAQASSPPEIAVLSVADIMESGEDELDLEDWLDDPVGHALREGIEALGRHLFRVLGNTGKMGDVLERVASRDEKHYSSRATIMDKRWDGIGSDSDIWVA